nr:unnamed protein product [Spirometra erinaceieuropaei]
MVREQETTLARFCGLANMHKKGAPSGSPSHSKVPQPTDCNEQVQRLANLPVAAADENASVGNRRHQLRGTVQSTTLAVLGNARSQHQDWFDDNDTAINSLLPENHLHKAYVERPTDANNSFLQLTLPSATVAPRDAGHLDGS